MTTPPVNPRRIRLEEECKQLQALNDASDHVRVQVVRNNPHEPPERYRIVFSCRGIVGIDAEMAPVFGASHEVEIYCDHDFPSEPPRLRWKSAIWHPNIQHDEPKNVCINKTEWLGTGRLVDICHQLFEMAQYRNYHAASTPPYPLDSEVAAWVREYAEPRGIVDKTRGISVDAQPFYRATTGATTNTARIKIRLSEARPRPVIRILGPQIAVGRGAAMQPLGGLTQHICDDSENIVSNVVISQSVLREVTRHMKEDVSLEIGGFLLGCELHCSTSELPTTVVMCSCRARHTEGTPTRLFFTNDTWRDLDDTTDALAALGPPLQRLGWYHSHIGWGIFLSNHDLDVCKAFEGRHYPLAFVFDPLANQAGFFVKGNLGYVRQGFWELHDLQNQSIVEWTNVRKGNRTV